MDAATGRRDDAHALRPGRDAAPPPASGDEARSRCSASSSPPSWSIVRCCCWRSGSRWRCCSCSPAARRTSGASRRRWSSDLRRHGRRLDLLLRRTPRARRAFATASRWRIRLATFLVTGLLFLTTTRMEEVAYALGRLGVPYLVGFTLTLAFRLVPVFFDVRRHHRAGAALPRARPASRRLAHAASPLRAGDRAGVHRRAAPRRPDGDGARAARLQLGPAADALPAPGPGIGDLVAVALVAGDGARSILRSGARGLGSLGTFS